MKQRLSTYLNDDIIDIQFLSEWFLSKAYKVTGKKNIYVVREVVPWMPWFEYEEDIIKSFGISHKMYNNAENLNKIKSYGVLHFDGKVYHIQDFKSWNILIDRKFLNEQNILKIAKKIWTLHNLWKKEINFDDAYKNILYKKSFRKIITHQETTFSIYEWWISWITTDTKILQDLIKKMIDVYFDVLVDSDSSRLTYLHGDFWNGNFIENYDDVYFIDFSRIPYGEPWIDVWTFVANLELWALVENDDTLLRFKKLFLDEYIKVTGDNNIEKYFSLSRLWVLFLHFSPLLQKFLNWSDEIKEKILKDFTI